MLVGEVFARMGLDSKQYEKNLGRLEGVTQKQANTLGGIFKNAFSVALGMGVFEAVKRGFRAVVGESISFNAQMEQARIGFTTMLGSAERAQVFLDDMAKFAAKTPFEFPELLDASKRMLAYGFAAKDVLPTMEAVGNASAAVGLGTEGINRIILALGQMRAKGKLSAEEMRQLTETGIPAWEILAEAMGKTTAEIMDMQSKGLIPADRAIKMLVEGMNKRFPNMMAQMENTWEGVTSTIKDIWKMTIGAVTQNLFQGVVSWLQKVRDFAVGFYDTFQKYGLQRAISESFGPEVAAMVSVLGATLRGLASVVSAVTGFITQYGKQIRFVAVVMGTYLVLLKTVTLAKWLATVATTALTNSQLLLAGQSSATTGIIGFLSNVITFYKVQMLTASATTNVLAGALARVQAALYAVHTALGPIGWAILAISAALGIGVSLWSKYNQVVQNAAQQAQMDKMAQQQQDYVDSVNEAAKGTESQADALDELGKASQKNLQSFDEVHNLMEETASAGLSVPTLDEGIVPPIPEMELPGLEDFAFDMDAAIADAKSQMGGFWGWLGTLASETWDNIKQWGTNLWEGVKGGWDGFANYCSSLWENLKSGAANSWAKIKSDAATMWEGVKGAWGAFSQWAGGLWDGVKDKWGGFKEWASQTWDNMSSKASNTWASIKTGAATGWENIRKTVVTKWDAFKTGAASTWDQVKTGAGIAWQNIKTGAAAGWNGIKTAISTKWDSLKSGASTTWSNIKLTISGKWNDLKAEAPTSWENIKTSISTRWNDLKSQAPTVWENVKNSIATRWNALKAEAPTTWESIKTGIATRWDSLKNSAPGTWDNIKTAISSRFDEAKANVLTAAQTMYDKVPKTWDEMRAAIGALNNKVLSAITSPFEDAKKIVLGIVESAKNWGKNMMSNVVDGIKSKVSAVTQAARNVANTIKGFLGFGSPTEEGPGRDADKWAPNLMQMYSGGITAGIPKVRSSVNAAASELTGLTAMPSVPSIPTATAGIAGSADAIAQAVYRAMMDAARITSASTDNQPQGTQEIVLRIDSSTFARLMLPSIIKEGQRQGLNLVVRPQGV